MQQLSLPVSGPTDNTANPNVVHYRVGLNPVQEACREAVEGMSDVNVGAFLDKLYGMFPLLKPVYPRLLAETALANVGEAYFTPNDLVEHLGLHPDTVDKYLHSYIGVFAGTPTYKQDRMGLSHHDAPWGELYARYIAAPPLPLRLVSGRALVFIIMAPTSIYRPTTGDAELVARWQQLVDLRNAVPALFGVPKGAPKRIDKSAPTLKSTRRVPKANTTNTTNTEEPAPMPIPSLFSLPLTPPDEEPETTPPPPPTPEDADAYFAAIADLRGRAERLRALLDLLPPQEVEQRVADYFRAGLTGIELTR